MSSIDLIRGSDYIYNIAENMTAADFSIEMDTSARETKALVMAQICLKIVSDVERNEYADWMIKNGLSDALREEIDTLRSEDVDAEMNARILVIERKLATFD